MPAIPGRQDKSRCPSCGERVSPYAAGCAVCGADLDHRRFDNPDAVERVRRQLPTTFGMPFWLVAMLGILIGFFVLSIVMSALA